MSPRRPRAGAGERGFRLCGEVAGAGLCVLVDRSPLRLGSAPDNDAVIAVAAVSRHHAVLELTAGGLTAKDLDSRNGTFVNGTRVEQSVLRPGDLLQLGPTPLTVEEVAAGDARLAIAIPPGASGEARSKTPDSRGTDDWTHGEAGEEPTWIGTVPGSHIRRCCATDGSGSLRCAGEWRFPGGRLRPLRTAATALPACTARWR